MKNCRNIILLLLLAACNNEHKPPVVEEVSAQAPLTFLDSVARQYALTIPQITSHTQIPGMFYNGVNSGAGFSGDNVIDLAYGYKGAILNCSNRNWRYKFLLVMDTVENENVSYQVIYSDCDRNEFTEYITTNYKFLNDSLFEITETKTPASAYAEKNHLKSETTIKKWRISSEGEIEDYEKTLKDGQ